MTTLLADPPVTTTEVEADLHYLVPMSERPFNYTYDAPVGTASSNTVYAPHRVLVRNIRALRNAPDLEKEGFSLVDAPTLVSDFYDEAELRAVYYPEIERILKAETGADRVFVFDHTIRRRVEGATDQGRSGPRQPVPRVHVDHTERSGPQRVRDLLPDEADALLRGRVQIINVWRPIRGPLRDAPLAVADARTVSPDDLVASDLIYPNRTGETYQVTYSPAHRWFYAPDMSRDEVLLLKCYDSRRDGQARFAPHTAFTDPSVKGPVLPRESIEIRTLVFHAA